MRKIRFIIIISLIAAVGSILSGCIYKNDNGVTNADSMNDEDMKEPSYEYSLPLDYATQFSIDYYSDGYVLIQVKDGADYILVPSGMEKKSLGAANPVFISEPENIYLAASSAMDLFKVLGELDLIKSCSTKASDYSDNDIQKLIEDESITYIGKYSAPDYESLLTYGTDLCIESTMIYHTPKVKKELEELGLPVLVERSSYENEPLGRLEWIKLYGVLTGKLSEAEDIFNEAVDKVTRVSESVLAKSEDKNDEALKVLFFYISSNGYVNVRKPGDYVTRMIEMAGGEYALDGIAVDEENALSTMNIEWEAFYDYAHDADIIIYNSTIDGGVSSISELIGKNEVLGEFSAVKNKRVYCSNQNMFQTTSAVADIIVDLNKAINGNNEDLMYLKALD